jgi:hypothetical protein
VLKDIFIGPGDFHRQTDDGFQNTMLIAGSIRLDPSGGTLDDHSCSLGIPVLVTGNKVTASPYRATVVVPVPADADTSGCIVPIIDYTMINTFDAADDKVLAWYAAAQYIQTGPAASALSNSACVNAAAASYVATASGEVMSVCMSQLPSFGANDRLLALQIGWDASTSPADGDSASPWAILSLRLRYTANVLGVASPE